MIEIRDLTKSYKKHAVLKGLSMTVQKGEVYGFLGKNGSGKSTTMNILSGLIPKNGGFVAVNGQEVSTSNIIPLGYLPEAPSMYEYMTGYEYVQHIAACCRFQGDIKKRAKEVIEMVGLTHAADRQIKGYSRGMQQRIAMSAALFAGHDVIILDEPTSALDPEGRADMIHIIENLKHINKTILLSTHILSDVERVADRVGILFDGKLALEGTMSEIENNFNHKIIRFTVDSFQEDLAQKITQLPYIQQLNIDGNTHFVFVKNDVPLENANKSLFRFLADESCYIKEYALQKTSLEEVYMKVVNGSCN